MSNELGLHKVPDTWAWSHLCTIGEIASGGTPSTKDATNFNGEIRWITPADLTGYKGKRISHGKRNLSKKGLEKSSAKLLPKGTILFSSRAPIGYVVIADNELCTNQGFKNLIPSESIVVDYIFHYLKSCKGLAESCASGTTFKELSATGFSLLPIPIPPTNEQKRIVDKIEELFSELNAGIDYLNAIKQKLRSYRQAVLKAAFEGKLTAEWWEKHKSELEPASKLIERIRVEKEKKYQEALDQAKNGTPKPRKPKELLQLSQEKIAELPQLPIGWCWTTIDHILEYDRECAYGVLQPGTDVPDGVPLIRVGDIQGGKIETSTLKLISPKIAEKYKRTKLKGGEVLISLVGAIGRTAVVDDHLAGANTARAVGVMPIAKEISNRFVELFFRREQKIQEMTSLSHEVARKTLNLEDVRTAKVAIAPVGEQYRIVDEIESRLSVADKVEQVVEENLKRAESLRQSILKKAFQGKLVHQDPNDEPAQKLLERIKEEKAVNVNKRKKD